MNIRLCHQVERAKHYMLTLVPALNLTREMDQSFPFGNEQDEPTLCNLEEAGMTRQEFRLLRAKIRSEMDASAS